MNQRWQKSISNGLIRKKPQVPNPQLKQITRYFDSRKLYKQVTELIQSEISTTSNQEEWNNIMKTMKKH